MTVPLNHTEDSEARIIASLLKQYAEALFKKDLTAMKTLFHPQCVIHASRRTPEGEWRRFTRTRDEFLTALSMQEAPPEFITGDVKILNRGHICSVWAEYEFRQNGKKVHEGVEGFHFVKLEGTWKIVSLIYTAEAPRK